MDLLGDEGFRRLGLELLSVSPDDPSTWSETAREYDLRATLLSDPANRVADRYGVMRWRVPITADVSSAEPGHTFVLVDASGIVRWVRDYGAPQNGGLMYVPPGDLVPELERRLG